MERSRICSSSYRLGQAQGENPKRRPLPRGQDLPLAVLPDQKHTRRLPSQAHCKVPCQDSPNRLLPSRRSSKMRLTFRQASHVYAALCSCRSTTSTLSKHGSHQQRPQVGSPLGGSWLLGRPAGCSTLMNALLQSDFTLSDHARCPPSKIGAGAYRHG